MKTYSKGLWVTLMGAIILSPDSILIRFIEEDVATIIFYRSILLSFWIGIALAFIYRKNFFSKLLSSDRLDLLCALFHTIGSFSFVLAITHTTIAKALLIISISPIISAILSYIFLSEKISIATFIAIIVSCFGFYIIFYEGGSWTDSWFGNLNAFISAGVLSGILVTSRYKKKSMMPAMFFSGILVGIISLVFFSPMQAASDSLLLLFILGFIIAAAFALLTLGPKYIPATEVSLIMLLETVITIVLAWWFLSEMPNDKTIIGGVIIIFSLVAHSLHQIKTQS